jgi:hypothetical protein
MLDDETRTDCKHAEQIALRDGRDLFEIMDRVGLLVTRDRHREIETNIVQVLLGQLSSQQTFLLASLGGDQSVTGAVNGVLKFVELFARTLEK